MLSSLLIGLVGLVAGVPPGYVLAKTAVEVSLKVDVAPVETQAPVVAPAVEPPPEELPRD